MWKKVCLFTSLSPRLLLGLVAGVAVLLAALCGGSDERPADLEYRSRKVPQDASPKEAYASFRKSVSAQDWRTEFECYTPKAQARFSYIIVSSALRLEFETNLYLQVEETLARHGIPDSELTEFWPNPRSMSSTRKANRMWTPTGRRPIRPGLIAGNVRSCRRSRTVPR